MTWTIIGDAVMPLDALTIGWLIQRINRQMAYPIEWIMNVKKEKKEKKEKKSLENTFTKYVCLFLF